MLILEAFYLSTYENDNDNLNANYNKKKEHYLNEGYVVAGQRTFGEVDKKFEVVTLEKNRDRESWDVFWIKVSLFFNSMFCCFDYCQRKIEKGERKLNKKQVVELTRQLSSEEGEMVKSKSVASTVFVDKIVPQQKKKFQ